MNGAWDVAPRDDRFDGKHRLWTGSVLLNDEIQHYCLNFKPPLISPFKASLLKPARYQLRLGPEARIKGQKVLIDRESPLVIKPHEVAIVRTLEVLHIPRFLIARWNLRVSMVYKGLMWVGALQVDPGWVGYLPCPLYNMSDQPVQIRYEEPLFTIDFVRTTAFIDGVSQPYHVGNDPPTNPPLATFDDHRLSSGPYRLIEDLTSLQKAVAELKERVVAGLAEAQKQSNSQAGVLFSVLGAMIAALAIIVVFPSITSQGVMPKEWNAVALVVSVAAFVTSVGAFRRAKRD